MDGRDPTVLQAIETVMSRQSDGQWWIISPRERTQAIYDEIRRLDRERMSEVLAPIGRKQQKTRYEMA